MQLLGKRQKVGIVPALKQALKQFKSEAWNCFCGLVS